MDSTHYQNVVKTSVKEMIRGRKIVNGRYSPRYPSSAEREFQRIARQFMRILNDTIRPHLPKIIELYRQLHMDEKSRFDANALAQRQLDEEFRKIEDELARQTERFKLEAKVAKAAAQVQRLSISEWKRICSQTLGINLLDSYYDGEFYRKWIDAWIADNVSQIKSIPKKTLDDMHEIIRNGFIEGRPSREVAKDIQAKYNISKRHAQLLARDQIATLNAQITRHQQEDAGITKYVWSDSRDIAVRECHRALNGKTFEWSDPPEMWYRTKSKGIVMTGRKCHPGEDYCCRCVPIPVFDLETLNLPISTADEESNSQQIVMAAK